MASSPISTNLLNTFQKGLQKEKDYETFNIFGMCGQEKFDQRG